MRKKIIPNKQAPPAYYQPPTTGTQNYGFRRTEKPAAGAKAKKSARPAEVALLALVLAFVLIALSGLYVAYSAVSGVNNFFAPKRYNNNPPQNSYAVLYVVGTIQNSGGGAFGAGEPSYKHGATVDYIKKLADNENNKGILLYMNTGGGGIYESDEVYRALEAYRQKTNRPVWAYMASTCASGGYYICTAAQNIVANHNAITGSIGVYIQLTDTSGLYEKIGIKPVLVKSGDNKAVGASGTPITEAQREVYQGIVNESYQRFVQLVAQGRGMDEAKALSLADGRPYTAKQALANGLVDELGDWEFAKKGFEELTGAAAFAPDFSSKTALGGLLESIGDIQAKSETAVLPEASETLPDGVPLAWAPGLEW